MTAQLHTGQRIGSVEDIPLGEGRAFAVHGDQIAVFRLRDGRIYALGAVCPHRGGPIADGQTDATAVVCPLHLNAFDFATGCSSTSDYALPVYPVEVDAAGDIVVYPRATTGDSHSAGRATPQTAYPFSAFPNVDSSAHRSDPASRPSAADPATDPEDRS